MGTVSGGRVAFGLSNWLPVGPNPWKIALVLEELSLPYDTKIWQTADQKRPPFTTKLNPNGFTPVIEDPNTGITLWEVCKPMSQSVRTY